MKALPLILVLALAGCEMTGMTVGARVSNGGAVSVSPTVTGRAGELDVALVL